MDTKSTLQKLSDWMPIFIIIAAQLSTTLWSHSNLSEVVSRIFRTFFSGVVPVIIHAAE